MSKHSEQRVMVVGGSRGIGAAIVRYMAPSAASLSFTYSSSEAAALQLAEETGSRALQLDSLDRDALFDTLDANGPLDVLVINAGILVAGDPLTLDPDDIDRLFYINVHAPYHAAVAAARSMPAGGRIIFIGSTNADRVPVEGLSAYSASKAALVGMTKGLARDFGPLGITVNVVQPGPTDTDMNPADDPMKDMMHSFMAIKRHATGGEVAALVAWLAGPDAAMITGAALTIDGGFAA
ncbi:SDR family oxidoreductase [Pseudomonas sp. 3A(2025)]